MASTQKNSVAIIGSGNWATAIAKVVATNVENMNDFEKHVNMFVFEEQLVDGTNLSDYINQKNENIKYLPGVKLPKNIIAVPDLVESVKNANYVILVVPNYFIIRCCKSLLGKTRPGAVAIILGKSLDRLPGEYVTLSSAYVTQNLKMPTSVFVSTNLAVQIALNQFCEITIGYKDMDQALAWKSLFATDFIRVNFSKDVAGVEVLNCSRDLLGLMVGACDGFGLHYNYKMVLVRLFILDMICFLDIFYPTCKLRTLFKTCGIPEIIVGSFGNRARKLGSLFAELQKPLSILEQEYLHGQRVPGPSLCRKMYNMVKNRKCLDKFPMIVAAYKFLKYGERNIILDAVNMADATMYHPINLK